jgi:uncharacterized protein
MTKTTIKFFAKKSYTDAVLFTGLPGIGLVGKICVDYFLKQLKPTKIAEVFSTSFPPSVQTKNGIVENIKDEIYHFNFKGKDFLFLAGPVQPSLDVRLGSMEEHYEFAETIAAELSKVGVREIVTLAGINVGEKRMHSEPKIIVASTSKKSLDEWKKAGALSDRPEGLISGAAGLLLAYAKNNGMEGSCLMGETNARIIFSDHGAAKAMLELLVKKYGFNLDMSGIEKEATEIENAFKQLSKQFEEPEDKPDKLSYVR